MTEPHQQQPYSVQQSPPPSASVDQRCGYCGRFTDSPTHLAHITQERGGASVEMCGNSVTDTCVLVAGHSGWCSRDTPYVTIRQLQAELAQAREVEKNLRAEIHRLKAPLDPTRWQIPPGVASQENQLK